MPKTKRPQLNVDTTLPLEEKISAYADFILASAIADKQKSYDTLLKEHDLTPYQEYQKQGLIKFFKNPPNSSLYISSLRNLLSKIQSRDMEWLISNLHTGNHCWRAIFRNETNIDLGKTNKSTELALKGWRVLMMNDV